MNSNLPSQFTIRLFIGCPLNSELKMHLKQSRSWNQTTIQPVKNLQDLVEIHRENKSYLGCYISSDTTTMNELHQTESFIKDRLKFYCPTYDMQSVKPCIFTQVFIA